MECLEFQEFKGAVIEKKFSKINQMQTVIYYFLLRFGTWLKCTKTHLFTAVRIVVLFSTVSRVKFHKFYLHGKQDPLTRVLMHSLMRTAV